MRPSSGRGGGGTIAWSRSGSAMSRGRSLEARRGLRQPLKHARYPRRADGRWSTVLRPLARWPSATWLASRLARYVPRCSGVGAGRAAFGLGAKRAAFMFVGAGDMVGGIEW